MHREAYFLVVGIDYGTSFSKVVVKDQVTKQAQVVEVDGHWLIPSVVGIANGDLYAPLCSTVHGAVPYLKVLAWEMVRGGASEVTFPPHLVEALGDRPRREALELVLAWYFANIIAGTRRFLATSSHWRDFGARADDFITYQLSVPTGYHANGEAHPLFANALRCGYLLAPQVDGRMNQRVELAALLDCLSEAQAQDLSRDLDAYCFTYPEVAAAVQTALRARTALDGLYISIDVGAGTVDLNAFRRYTAQGVKDPTEEQQDTNRLLYYATAMTFLGASRIIERRRTNPFVGYSIELPQNANDWGLAPLPESEVMNRLQSEVSVLFHRALCKQPNLGTDQGRRTWDRCQLYAWGGGFKHRAYGDAVTSALAKFISPAPEVVRLPHPADLDAPSTAEFDRLAVAYGLSFNRHNLQDITLPDDIKSWSPPQSDPPMLALPPGYLPCGKYDLD